MINSPHSSTVFHHIGFVIICSGTANRHSNYRAYPMKKSEDDQITLLFFLYLYSLCPPHCLVSNFFLALFLSLFLYISLSTACNLNFNLESLNLKINKKMLYFSPTWKWPWPPPTTQSSGQCSSLLREFSRWELNFFLGKSLKENSNFKLKMANFWKENSRFTPHNFSFWEILEQIVN